MLTLVDAQRKPEPPASSDPQVIRMRYLRHEIGLSLRAIAKLEGVSYEAVRLKIGNTGHGFSSDGRPRVERQQLEGRVRQLLQEDKSPTDIAQELHISIALAYKYAKLAGWKPRFARLAEQGLKRCMGCKKNLPLEAFGQDLSNKDGKMTRCRPCNNASSRASRLVRVKPAQEE